MVSTTHLIIGLASTVARLSSIAFLRWIPGHHFPPLIVTSTAIYLSLVFVHSKSFGTGRPSLREAFPKLFSSEAQTQEKGKEPDTAANNDHDEPAVYHDEVAVLKTLVFGIPNWQEWEFSYITIFLNVLAMSLSLDLVFRGPLFHSAEDLTFSRLGFVDDSSAKILVRDPNSANLPIYAYVRPVASPDWSTVDTIYYMGDETDHTYPLIISGLEPDTLYNYALSNDLEGTFKTAPSPRSYQARSLTFLTSSCIKANFPYNPFAHSLSIAGFRYMSSVLSSLPSPVSFMLFLGDFIYVDVPYRLSSSQNHYRSEYRRVYASPSWNLPGLKLPWIHTLDDHEIANDWAGGNDTEPFLAASDPFMHYHVSVNPPLPPTTKDGPEANTTYFQFTQGPASFFMLDTRRYRTQPESQDEYLSGTTKPLYGSSSSHTQTPQDGPTMLGFVQLQALLSFLTAPEPPNVHWKFVASSVPFTKNWRFGTSDTWGGFPTERKRVLDAMHFAEQYLGVRVIILSGDRHEFAAIRFPPVASINPGSHTTNYDLNPEHGPHEFSVGPLSMFYLPIRTFKQVDNEDVALAYFPDGNSKLGSIEIQTLQGRNGRTPLSTLKYTLWVDGSPKWSYKLHTNSDAMGRKSNLATWKLRQEKIHS